MGRTRERDHAMHILHIMFLNKKWKREGEELKKGERMGGGKRGGGKMNKGRGREGVYVA